MSEEKKRIVQFQPKHDIGQFCLPYSSSNGCEMVRYDPKTKEIAATDGRVIVYVPIDGGDDEWFIAPEHLAALAGSKRDCDVSGLQVREPYPEAGRGSVSPAPHDRTMMLDSRILLRVLKHLRRSRVEQIQIECCDTSDGHSQLRIVGLRRESVIGSVVVMGMVYERDCLADVFGGEPVQYEKGKVESR